MYLSSFLIKKWKIAKMVNDIPSGTTEARTQAHILKENKVSHFFKIPDSLLFTHMGYQRSCMEHR